MADEAELRERLIHEAGRAFKVPLSVLDGRPWVPRLDEVPDVVLRTRRARPAREPRLEPTWVMPPEHPTAPPLPLRRPREMVPAWHADVLDDYGVLPPTGYTLADCPAAPCPAEHPWIILEAGRAPRLLSCDPAL